MMIFTSDMHPKALLQNKGEAFSFTCDLCGADADGTMVQPDGEREAWAVLPEEWSEIEDRRTDAPKQFVICCEDGECQHTAKSRAD